MKPVCLFLLTALLLGGFSDGNSWGNGTSSDPTFQDCFVRVKRKVEIPAQKDGTLITLSVIEGFKVAKGDVLAVVDDREAKAAVKVAEKGMRAAKQRADDDIEEQYAAAAEEVAKVELQMDLEANKKIPTAVPAIEIRQKELVVKKSALQIEKAQKDQMLAALEADAKQAEYEAALVAMEKRTILAPFRGEVVNKWKEESEWVNPGDPILTLMQFDTLYVEGKVPASEFDRFELLGKNVTVTVPLARGRHVELTGKVVHVGQMIESGGEYDIRAEVANVTENGAWVVQPGNGQLVPMTVHLNE